jgi:hypothetical protein
MTIDEAKALIVRCITDLQGCKGTELMADKEVQILSSFDVPKLLEELVNDGKICEVEYILPAMHYRAKSMYFPAETKIALNGNCKQLH